jgi:type IV pilus assembly protein PilV
MFVNRTFKTKRAGFALFEVMIALLVVAVGLLGVAKMQALALKGTQLSGKRTLVALSAASLGAAIHGNKAYWNSGVAPSVTVTVSSAGAGVVAPSTLATAPTGLCTTKCSTTNLAARDLRVWVDNLIRQVPSFTGATITMVNSTTAPVSATITINWTESYVAANKSSVQSTSDPISKQSYVLYVQP